MRWVICIGFLHGRGWSMRLVVRGKRLFPAAVDEVPASGEKRAGFCR
jgi:hypothetical protein